MGFFGKIGVLLSASIAILTALTWYQMTKVPPIPELKNEWWGMGQPQRVDESIRPFKIDVPKEVIDDLNLRLKKVPKLVTPLEGIGFQYGFNSKYLQEVLEFWRTKYDWKERQAFLNSLPQFKTRVNGLDLHFIHAKPSGVPRSVQVVPLLLMHGWPGSVREFYELIPQLTTPRGETDFVFEVVAPSLPGYGFSEGASRPGLGVAQAAVIMKNLMERLGYQKFYVQGGDWGGAIATVMSILFPDKVLGLHSNFCFSNTGLANVKRMVGSVIPSIAVDSKYVDKMYPYIDTLYHVLEESGYMHIQATKPDTVGVALTDSPAGLAAYLLEKFSTWTDPSWKSLPDGGLTKKFTLTNLLDNVMIYWVTGSITTSMRFYSESFSHAQRDMQLDLIPVKVPTVCIQFPNELLFQSKELLTDKFLNLVRYSVAPRGGHFAAFEEPKLLANDIWLAVKLFRHLPDESSKTP